MVTMKDGHDVNVRVPSAWASNLPMAMLHHLFQTSHFNSTLATVRASRRTFSNAHRFLLRFGERGGSSATPDEEVYYEPFAFPFARGGLR